MIGCGQAQACDGPNEADRKNKKEKDMSAQVLVSSKPSIDEARIGIYAPSQPLSGVTLVGETAAVYGMGRGGYVRTEKTEESKDENFRLPA